jgi:hypothetical protein
VQFTRALVRSAITLRELDFALRAHSKVWRLGERIVRPPHVRRALELCGCARSSLRMHFGRLVERFSEGEESEDDDDDDDDDMPLVVRARKAIASDEDEDEDVNTSVGEREQQQQRAGPSKDVQATEAAWQRWSSSHRAIYSPFVHAPDLIAPAHPFGVYAPGTTPELALAHSSHVTYQDYDNEEEEEEDLDLDLMLAETTDEEALEVELKAEALLDAADARAAAAYEAGIWRDLGGTSGASLLRRSRKRRRSGDGEGVEVAVAMEEGGEDDGDDMLPSIVRARKRRKNSRAGGGGYDEVDVFKSPGADGGVNVSAAVIEDSDC